MAAKILFVVCAQALFIQCALSQCIGRGPALGPGLAPYGVGYDGIGYGVGPGCGCGGLASSGGGFPVTSISPLAPTGISIVSENTIEGTLSAGGEVPFLAAVALEGILPTVGAGAISYGCGNGAIGIASEGPINTGIVSGGPGYGPGLPAGPAYGPALAGPAYAGSAYAGPGYAGLGYGPGLAPGLGYNGLAGPGCGCGL